MSETGKPPAVEPAAGKPADRPRLVLITGLSGSGKSVVAKCFEDLGYYTVDNLPLPLLRRFLENPLELVRGYERIAVVTDVRAPGFAEEFPRLIAEIDRARIEPTLLFLEASDEILISVDGGIAGDTIADAARSGADLFVAGSAVFDAPDYRAAIADLVARAAETPRLSSLRGGSDFPHHPCPK